MDDNKYLEEGFNPEKLTMAQLRNIFIKHDVDFPSSAKKANLVDIFRSEIAPKAASLLARMNKVMPTDKGIVDADTESASPKKKSRVTSSEESPRRRTTRADTSSPRRSGRPKKPSAKVTQEEPEQSEKKPSLQTVPVPNLEPEKSPVKEAGSPSRRRVRKSTVKDPSTTANYKPEPVKNNAPITFKGTKRTGPEIETPARTKRVSLDNTSPVEKTTSPVEKTTPPNTTSRDSFSPNNYFQSGSSHLSTKKRHSSDKYTANDSSQSANNSLQDTSDSLQSTPDKPIQVHVPQTDPTKFKKTTYGKNDNFTGPQTEYKQRTSRPSFMPELKDLKMSKQFAEALQKTEKEDSRVKRSTSIKRGNNNVEKKMKKLEKEADLAIKNDEKKRKRDNKQKKIFTTIGKIFSFLLRLSIVSLFVVYAAWWREERFKTGYCDVSLDNSRTSDNLLDEYLDYIRPSCIPCPDHATCYPEFKAVCDDDYVYVRNPLSFGEFLPLQPSCVPDAKRQRRLMLFEQKLRDILRDKNAAAVCGESSEKPEMKEKDLRQNVYDMKAESLSDEEFDDLWKTAIERIEDSDEIIVRQDMIHRRWNPETEEMEEGIVEEKVVRSTSLANISLGCRFRLYIGGQLARFGKFFGWIAGSLAVIWILRLLIRRQLAKRKLTRSIAQRSLQRLITQAKDSDNDQRGLTQRFIAMVHLREKFEELSNDRNKSVWKAVERSIEDNPSIRVRQIEINGEIMRVWEWIGEEGGGEGMS